MTSSPFIPAGPPRFQHQREGLRRLIETRGICALLFDPGTGKTATTLDYASLLALKSPTSEARVLVIAPLAAVDTWVEQAGTYVHGSVSFHAEAVGGSIMQRAETLRARGAGDQRTGRRRAVALRERQVERLGGSLTLLVLNTDTFGSRRQSPAHRSRTLADEMVEAVKAYRPDLIVVDESHRLKGASSNTSRAIARLTSLCRRRVILTGTVMPHSPLDVFGQWRFLNPEAFHTADGRPMSWTSFRARFARMGGFMGREVVGFHRLDEMQQTMALNSIVARKEDVLDLPATTDVEVTVDLSPAEKQAYRDMKKNLATLLGNGAQVTVPNRLAQLMRLRQITSGYLPDDSGQVQVIGTSKVKTVTSIVEDTLAGEGRVVVFAHFRHEVAAIMAAVSGKASAGTEVLSITGDTSASDRQAIRQRFGSSEPTRLILVAQIKTLSLAVNELVTASHAVFASLSQQRDDYEQARARLDRQGQKRPVTFWHAVAPGTVDGAILDAHRTRTSVEDAVLRHVQDSSTQFV